MAEQLAEEGDIDDIKAEEEIEAEGEREHGRELAKESITKRMFGSKKHTVQSPTKKPLLERIDKRVAKYSDKVAGHYAHAREAVGKDLWSMTAGSKNTSEGGGSSSPSPRPRHDSSDHNLIRGAVDSRIIPIGSADLGSRGRGQRSGPVLDFWKNTQMPIGGDQRMFDSVDNLGISFQWKVTPVTISQSPRRNIPKKKMPSRYSKKRFGGRTWKKRQ